MKIKLFYFLPLAAVLLFAAQEADAAVRHPSGTLIKTANNSDIYMVDRDMKSPVLRGIYDTWIGQMYFVFNDYAITVSQEEMDSYRTIGGVNRYYIGKLLRGSDGKVYIIDTHYRKRHISSPEVFRGLGYAGTPYDPTAKTVYDTTQSHIDQFPTGDPITRTDIHPDGSVITTKTTGTVWLIEDGKKRQIRTDYIYEAMGLPWRKMLHRVLPEEIGRYPDGEQINTYPSGTLFKASDGKVYVVGEGKTLRHIPSIEVFNALGYQWKYAYGVFPELESFYAKDEPWTLDSTSKPYLAKHPNGTLVKTWDNPAIYLIENGQKRWISDPLVLESYNYRWDRIVTIAPEEMWDYPEGAFFNKMRDGSLMFGSDGKVYAVSNEKKRWIVSEEVFNALGYKWSQVKRISDAQLNTYETGDPIASAATHPNGTLIIHNNGVWLIEDGKKRPFYDVTAFEGNGYNWDKVITISDSEAALYPYNDPIIKMRDGELVRGPDGRIHVISDRRLRHVTSAGVYDAMGYKSDWFRVVSQSHLDWYSEGDKIPISAASQEVFSLDSAVYADLSAYYPGLLDEYDANRSYYNRVLAESSDTYFMAEKIINDILAGQKCFREYYYVKDNCDNQFDLSNNSVNWGNIAINGVTQVHNDTVDLSVIPEASEMMKDLGVYTLMYNNSSTVKLENLDVDYLLDFQNRNSIQLDKLVINLPINRIRNTEDVTAIENFVRDAKANGIAIYAFQFDDYLNQIDLHVRFEDFTNISQRVKAIDPTIKMIGVFYKEEIDTYIDKETNGPQADFALLKAKYDKSLPYFDEISVWFWNLNGDKNYIDLYGDIQHVFPGKTIDLGIYLRDYVNRKPLAMDTFKEYFKSMISLKLDNKINDIYIISSYWYNHPSYTYQTDFIRNFFNNL